MWEVLVLMCLAGKPCEPHRHIPVDPWEFANEDVWPVRMPPPWNVACVFTRHAVERKLKVVARQVSMVKGSKVRYETRCIDLSSKA